MDPKVIEKGRIPLCATQNCCPAVDFTQQDKVVITDDYGGKVTLTRSEWDYLKTKFCTPSPQGSTA